MIDVQEMFWSVAEYGKDYISGQDPVVEFNSKLNEAQRMAFDMISPEYDRNERIRVLLEPFTRATQVTSSAAGIIPFPPDFHRVLGGRYTQGTKRYPIYYAKENEIIESDYIPQRKADLSKGIAYLTYVNGTLVLFPKEAIEIDLSYLAKPDQAKLAYNYNVTREAFIQLDTTNTVDLAWNYDAYNLILSILLLKYGLITRDQFKVEIGNYGISSDLINAR